MSRRTTESLCAGESSFTLTPCSTDASDPTPQEGRTASDTPNADRTRSYSLATYGEQLASQTPNASQLPYTENRKL